MVTVEQGPTPRVPTTPVAVQTPAVSRAALPAEWAPVLPMGSGPGDPEHHADPAAQRQAPQSRRPGPCPAAAPPEVDSVTRVPARPSPSVSLRLASDMNDRLKRNEARILEHALR